MSPSDLPPEGQVIFARLSKRWAEEARAKRARQFGTVTKPRSLTGLLAAFAFTFRRASVATAHTS